MNTLFTYEYNNSIQFTYLHLQMITTNLHMNTTYLQLNVQLNVQVHNPSQYWIRECP